MVASIIVHGGAGVLAPARRQRCLEGCQAAAQVGWRVLAGGGTALDAVEAAVRHLEDDGEFNAGYGAVLDRDGRVEVDAAVMDGALRIGAVGAVPFVRHPVTLARRVLESDQHVLLVGEGALSFGRQHGIAPEPPEALITARAQSRWEREQSGASAPSATGDTVGALALDATGGLAAASSTGGISFKLPGRVGDSPIAGAGLYARDGAGAATATGHGESILRVGMCWLAVDWMDRRPRPTLPVAPGQSLAERAALEAVGVLTDRIARYPGGSRGPVGIITLDASGDIGHHRSADTMPWAALVDGVARSGL